MYYLWINPRDFLQEPYWGVMRCVASEWFCYPTTAQLDDLNATYVCSNDSVFRNMTLGIVADYCEDHRDELLGGATGPSDPALRLDALIVHLRSRFAAASV